jgi:hypothetical protein
MKKMSSLLVVTVFAGSLAAPALAQDATHHTKGADSTYKQSHNVSTKDFKGEHSMRGTISKIDHATGMVDVNTPDGMALALHFPSTAIQDLKEGAQVAVQMEIAKQPSPLHSATMSQK